MLLLRSLMLLPMLLWQAAPTTQPASLAARAERPIVIFAADETVTFSAYSGGDAPLAGPVTDRLMKNGDVPVQSGPLDLASGSANVSVPATEPRAYLLDVSSTAAPDAKPLVAGAAVDPTHITRALPAPADFDAF